MSTLRRQLGKMKQNTNEMLKKRWNAVNLKELEAPVTPMTGIGSRLRQLRVEDPSLSQAVGELSDLLDEAEQMNETIHRLKVAEVYRQAEIHTRFNKVLTTFTDTLR